MTHVLLLHNVEKVLNFDHVLRAVELVRVHIRALDLRSFPGSFKCLSTLTTTTSAHLCHCCRPAASEAGNNAAPAFVQLGIVGADVAPYIPQSEERLTAELHGGQKVSGE